MKWQVLLELLDGKWDELGAGKKEAPWALMRLSVAILKLISLALSHFVSDGPFPSARTGKPTASRNSKETFIVRAGGKDSFIPYQSARDLNGV